MTLDYEFMGQDIPVLLRALPSTITLTLWSMLVALLFAVICGAFILVRIPVLKQLVIVINTFIKGVPLVIQLLFCYYAVPIVAKGSTGSSDTILIHAIRLIFQPPYWHWD